MKKINLHLSKLELFALIILAAWIFTSVIVGMYFLPAINSLGA